MSSTEDQQEPEPETTPEQRQYQARIEVARAEREAEAELMRSHMRSGYGRPEAVDQERVRALLGGEARVVSSVGSGRLPTWANVAQRAHEAMNVPMSDEDLPRYFDPDSKSEEDRRFGPGETVAKIDRPGIGSSAQHPDLARARAQQGRI